MEMVDLNLAVCRRIFSYFDERHICCVTTCNASRDICFLNVGIICVIIRVEFAIETFFTLDPDLRGQ